MAQFLDNNTLISISGLSISQEIIIRGIKFLNQLTFGNKDCFLMCLFKFLRLRMKTYT